MNTNTNPSSAVLSAAQQIDAMIKETGDWRGETLSRLRAVIEQSDPTVVEEVKWKNPPTQWEFRFGRMVEYFA